MVQRPIDFNLESPRLVNTSQIPMGEFLMQSLQYSGPFNPVLIGQGNDGISKKNDKNQEYLSKSKVKMA